MTPVPTRRALIAWVMLATLPATALTAQDLEEPDPSDLVPRRFSVEAFRNLTETEIYDVHLAIRRGRRILIEGYTASESREIIERAARDWPRTRQQLR